eukprot:331025-Amphidinium_carterae.2
MFNVVIVSASGHEDFEKTVVKTLLLSRAQAWVLWFPLNMLMPCCGFPCLWSSESAVVKRAERNSTP